MSDLISAEQAFKELRQQAFDLGRVYISVVIVSGEREEIITGTVSEIFHEILWANQTMYLEVSLNIWEKL